MIAAASSSSTLSKSSPSGAVPRPSSVTRTFVRPSLRIFFRRARFGGARGFGLSDVLREHRHDADALPMGGHHHAERLGFIETKHRLEDPDHEVARRIVVVE